MLTLTLGPYKISFDETKYDIEQIDPSTAVVAVKGKPDHKATIAIKDDPVKTSPKGMIDDTKVLARSVVPDLIQSKISQYGLPITCMSGTLKGLHAQLDYKQTNQQKTCSFVRDLFPLDAPYWCEVFAVILPEDEITLGLMSQLMDTIYIEGHSSPT